MVDIPNPLISIYVISHNYAGYLPKALESIKRQSYTNWELFIIDDASNDDTSVIATEFASGMSQKITTIRNDSRLGLQRIANKVLELCSGEYVMRLDADDWLDESALLVLTQRIVLDRSIGLVYPNFHYVDDAGRHIGTEWRMPLDYTNLAGAMPPHGACCLVSVRLLRSVGGYTEGIDAQDGWELWLRALQRTEVAHVETPLFFYRQHGQSLSRDSQRLLRARGKVVTKIQNATSGDYKPRILAIVPIKESYVDFENVPYTKFNNTTVLRSVVTESLQSRFLTKLYLLGENDDAAKRISHHLESIVDDRVETFSRKASGRKGDFCPIDIFIEARDRYLAKESVSPTIFVYLNLHSVFRTRDHIDESIDLLMLKIADSVVSVIPEKSPIFLNKSSGYEILNKGRFNQLDFDSERLFRFNGALITFWAQNLNEGDIFGAKIELMEMSESSSLILSSKVKHTY